MKKNKSPSSSIVTTPGGWVNLRKTAEKRVKIIEDIMNSYKPKDKTFENLTYSSAASKSGTESQPKGSGIKEIEAYLAEGVKETVVKEEKLKDPKIFHYRELGFTVSAWLINECVMAFNIYEVAGEGENGPCYDAKGTDTASYDLVEDIKLAEVIACGSLKWDGCVNFILGEDDSEGGYQHFCGKEHMEGFGKTLARLYDIANEMMPGHSEYLI